MSNVKIKSDPFSDAVCSILDAIALEQNCTREELIQAAMRKQKDTPGSSVTAIMSKAQTTIDNATGDQQVTRAGVFKGFGKGFRDYVLNGPKSASVQATIVTGQLPAGHEHAGKWAVQANIYPFDTKVLANTFADGQLTPMIEAVTGGKAFIRQ